MPILFARTEVFPEHVNVLEVDGIEYTRYFIELDNLILDFEHQRMEGVVKLLAVNPSNATDFQQRDQATFQIEEPDFQFIFTEVTVWSGEDAGPMSLDRLLGAIYSNNQLEITAIWR